MKRYASTANTVMAMSSRCSACNRHTGPGPITKEYGRGDDHLESFCSRTCRELYEEETGNKAWEKCLVCEEWVPEDADDTDLRRHPVVIEGVENMVHIHDSCVDDIDDCDGLRYRDDGSPQPPRFGDWI